MKYFVFVLLDPVDDTKPPEVCDDMLYPDIPANRKKARKTFRQYARLTHGNLLSTRVMAIMPVTIGELQLKPSIVKGGAG